MPYNFVADGFHTHENFVADFFQAKCDFSRKTVFAFLSPSDGSGATYTVYLRLIGKLVMNFLFLLI